MVPSKTAASRLLVPGHIVGSSDGQPWLVTSSLKTKDGVRFKLADLMGRSIDTPPRFDPVPFRIARIATLLRLAYNKDFDEYVKSAIRAAGLPVDQSMNWAKYLYKIFPRYLPTHDEEIIDEALHEIIIRVLVNRNVLSPENPSGFQQSIEKYPQEVQGLSLEKQVTEFLKKSFTFKIDETVKYVNRVLKGQAPGEDEEPGQDLFSLEPEEGEGESLLNTKEQGTGIQDFQQMEENIDLGDYRTRGIHSTKGTFSEGFKAWLPGFRDRLKKKYKLPSVSQYMRLLTLLHDETKSVGKYPKLTDIEVQWKKLQDRHESSARRLDHDGFVKLFRSLPIVVETYVRTHYHGQEDTLPPLIRILNRMGDDLRQKQLEESNQDREERRTQKETAMEPTPASEEAGMRDLPPESHISALKKQYEVPKCKNCGSGDEPRRCKGCQEYFCSTCMMDHHANNPGHDGVL